MKKIISVLLVLVLTAACLGLCASAEDKTAELRFRDDGTFKIMVFSDTQDDRYPAYDMLNFVKLAAQTAQPDLIVFTGDLVEDSRIGDIGIDGQSFREGVNVKSGGELDIEKTLDNIKVATDNVFSILEETGIPYAIAMGNNDYKCGIGSAEWLEIFSAYPHLLCEDISDDEGKRIDYNLEIKGNDGSTKFNIWLMDSGRGSVNNDQVEWYKSKASALAAANGGTPVPALLFQHVQVSDIGNLFEECNMWDEGSRMSGGKFYRLNKEIASGRYTFAYEPGQTSYEFLSWQEQGDVIGAFFGHQHVEGFSGVWQGIELGFTYGCEMAKPGPYGYRLITLHEDDVKNYDNELYTYEGSYRTSAEFVKQVDTPYTVPSNPVEALFIMIKSFLQAIGSAVIGLFA